MTSHEYARALQAVADRLLERKAFDLPTYAERLDLTANYFDDKARFLLAARALGSGNKSTNELTGYYTFTPTDFEGFSIEANKDKMCRLVRPAEYACEPLLTAEEEAQVGRG